MPLGPPIVHEVTLVVGGPLEVAHEDAGRVGTVAYGSEVEFREGFGSAFYNEKSNGTRSKLYMAMANLETHLSYPYK